jgi:putative ABC transport system substrate-binding protein
VGGDAVAAIAVTRGRGIGLAIAGRPPDNRARCMRWEAVTVNAVSRRLFVLSMAALSFAGPRLSHAQSGKPPRVVWFGFDPLLPIDRTIVEPWHATFRDLGWVEGKSLILDYRYVDSAPEGRLERISALLATLLAEGVDVLFSVRPEVVLTAKKATRKVPIVFAGIGDPVGTGLVPDLARPGANVTGVSYDAAPQIVGKQLQLLHEVVPDARTLGILAWRDGRDNRSFVEAAHSAGITLGVSLNRVEVADASELDEVFLRWAGQSVGGILVVPSAYAWVHREKLIALAAKHRLPTIYGMRESVYSGGLLSYGSNPADQVRQAVALIDKILKGAKPGDLPVEQPTRFDLLVNLKTAKALGLAIPQTLLLQAAEVIRP